MTWIDFMKYYDETITEDIKEDEVKILYAKQFKKIRITILIDKSEIYLPTIEFSRKNNFFPKAITVIFFCLFFGIAWR